MEGLNATWINALALIIEGFIAVVVVISHGDKIFLLFLVVACEQIQDDYRRYDQFLVQVM